MRKKNGKVPEDFEYFRAMKKTGSVHRAHHRIMVQEGRMIDLDVVMEFV